MSGRGTYHMDFMVAGNDAREFQKYLLDPSSVGTHCQPGSSDETDPQPPLVRFLTLRHGRRSVAYRLTTWLTPPTPRPIPHAKPRAKPSPIPLKKKLARRLPRATANASGTISSRGMSRPVASAIRPSMLRGVKSRPNARMARKSVARKTGGCTFMPSDTKSSSNIAEWVYLANT